MAGLQSIIGLAVIALTLARTAPFAEALGKYKISMAEINEEADRQKIERPETERGLNIYSTVLNGFISVKQGANSEGEKTLRIRRWQGHSDNVFVRPVPENSYDSLVTFITNRGEDNKVFSWNGLSVAERLVRRDDELIAKVTTEASAAHFILKRYPPVCEGSATVDTTKPQFVQLMLVERTGGLYHRALLQVTYNYRGQIKFKFLKSSTGKDDDCKSPQSPSVVPGTLFMLKYN